MNPLHVHLRVALLNARVLRHPDATPEVAKVTLSRKQLKLDADPSILDDPVATVRFGRDPASIYENTDPYGNWLEITFPAPIPPEMVKAFPEWRGWKFKEVRIWILGPGIIQTVAIGEVDTPESIDEMSGAVCVALDSMFPLIRSVLGYLGTAHLEDTNAPFGIPKLLRGDTDFAEADEYQYEDHYFVPARSSSLDKYFADPKAEIVDYKGYRLSMLTASVLWRAREVDNSPVPSIDQLPKLLRAAAVVLARFKLASQLPRVAGALLKRGTGLEGARGRTEDDPRQLREIQAQYEVMRLQLRRMVRLMDEAELIYAAASATVGSPTLEAEDEEFRNAGHSILSLAEGLEAKRAARDDHLIESLLLIVSVFTFCGIALDGFDFLKLIPEPGTEFRRLYLLWWLVPAVLLMLGVLGIRWRFWRWLMERFDRGNRETGWRAR